MTSFHLYFLPQNIIKLICKYRLKYTRRKHKLQLLSEISSSTKTINDVKNKDNVPSELSNLLPSRRNWYKPNTDERNRFSDSHVLKSYAIKKTIYTTHLKVKYANGYVPPVWYGNLSAFIKSIQSRINNPRKSKITNPEIKPVKKENTKSCRECRPISIYNLEDRIIISLTAKYFTEIFDQFFSDSSFAFRAVIKEDSQRITRTHHDAIKRVSNFITDHRNSDIFVAECDIQKFYDCVNHELVLQSLHELSNRFGIKLDDRALEIFKQYLDSYSFSRDVYPKNGTEFFKNFNLEGTQFGWVCDGLKNKFYKSNSTNPDLSNMDIGIPQGGALSCFIANLLLHQADEAVNQDIDNNLCYLRFCDDMIILHTNKEKCYQALERYISKLSELKLLIHEPLEISNYSKQNFWNPKVKSKKPFKLAPTSENKSNVPWLSFVGYQIKYDGSIRIRKKSFIKELKKQREECNQILNALEYFNHPNKIDNISKKSLKYQMRSLESRLISMSVGRIKLFEKKQDSSLCWTNGFKELNINPTAEMQLKLLDRNRTQNLYEIKKKLKELIIMSDDDTNSKKGKKKKKRKEKYFGSPFSYHNFLIKKRIEQ